MVARTKLLIITIIIISSILVGEVILIKLNSDLIYLRRENL